MNWQLSWRADPRARQLADRHYNRQSVGANDFVPPGRCLVLYCSTPTGEAFWVTSHPQYVQHAWPGAWVCSAFRNEGAGLSSTLITEAVSATCWKWPVPPQGMVTFINTEKVRKKRDWGRCYRRAGFKEVGLTKGGLIVLGLTPAEMPPPSPPLGATRNLF